MLLYACRAFAKYNGTAAKLLRRSAAVEFSQAVCFLSSPHKKEKREFFLIP